MTAETGAGVASKISLRPVFDDVAGSVQYLTKVSTYFVSDMLPKSATVGQRWLCQADGNIYEVAVAASGSAYAQLTLVGPKAVSVVEPWDGATVPDDGDEVVDANFPDASYYAVPGGLVDGSEAPTLAFLSDSAYVSVRDLDIGPDEFQVSQNERPADTYAAIAAAGKTSYFALHFNSKESFSVRVNLIESILSCFKGFSPFLCQSLFLQNPLSFAFLCGSPRGIFLFLDFFLLLICHFHFRGFLLIRSLLFFGRYFFLCFPCFFALLQFRDPGFFFFLCVQSLSVFFCGFQ
mgnify:CR=1 FL=1